MNAKSNVGDLCFQWTIVEKEFRSSNAFDACRHSDSYRIKVNPKIAEANLS